MIISTPTCSKNLFQVHLFFQVPEDYSFIETFDLLFKFHYVLNFSFDDNLKTLMNFIQHFYYKIEFPQIKMSPHQMRVYNDLSQWVLFLS